MEEEAHPVVVADGDLTRAAPHRITDAGGTRDRRSHRSRFLRAGGDDLDFAHRLTMPPDGARDLGSHHAGLAPDRSDEPLRLGPPVRQEHLRTALLEPRDAAQHLLGGQRTEPRQGGEPSVARRLLQFLHRVDPESLVDPADARGTEARHAEHLEESFRCGFAQLVEEGRLAAPVEILEHFEDFGCESAPVALEQFGQRP